MSEVAQVTHSSPDGHIPQLRFPQFSHDWAISTIGNLAKIDTGNRDTQDRVNSGKYPFYVRSNTVERINEYAFDGEAILTSGDGVGVGKNFHYVVGKFNYHQRVYSIHNFTNSTNGKFIYYYFADKFYRRVSRLSAKNSVDSVRMSMISDMPISIPAKPEQQKIAAFLTAVDNKIELLRQKQELLGEYKKGLMQQIFSQAIRFKADDGSDFPDWEEKKLGDVAEIVGGGTPPTAVEKYWNGNIQWFTPTEIKSKFIVNSKRTITQVGLDTSSAKLLPKGTLLFSSRATVGEVGIAVQECTTNQGFQSFIVNKNNEPEFLYNWIIKNKKEFIRRASGSTFLEIGKSEIKKIKLHIPALPEQTKIANFLSSIDSKIEQVGKQLDESKQFKKALLQQMFI